MRQRGLVISTWIAFALVASECAIAKTDSGSSFLRPEGSQSSNSPNAPCDVRFPSKVPVRCWVGQQFLVLPIDPQLRSYGYQTINGGSGPYGHASYDELAGKTVTVTNVEWQLIAAALPDSGDWVVTFRDDASGATYNTRTVILPNEAPDDAIVDNFALLRDLKAARDKYLGKTFWMKSGWLPQLGENGSISFSSIVKYKKFVPTVVSDVLIGWEASAPVRVVIKNDASEEGYFDMAVSGTNRTRNAAGEVGDAAFAKVMASSDPKLAHKWPAKVWDAIENQKVFVGMSMEQARLSWGDPHDVNRTVVGGHVHEQWVYEEHNYLYFEDGRLGAIQD